MALLEPKLAILDETDSGLDIDALKLVANGVNAMRCPERAFVVVTHYQRLLNYIVPDFVHVLSGGRIVKSGGKELALELEAKGYGWIEGRRATRRRRYGRRRRELAWHRWYAREELQTLAGGARRASRAAARAGWRTCAITRRRAVRRAGIPDGARRGVALHEHRPARRDRVRPAPPSTSGAPSVLDGFAYTDAAVPAGDRQRPLLARRCRGRTGLPAGVQVGSLATALTEQPDVVQRYLGQLADSERPRLHGAEHRVRRRTARSCHVPDGLVLEEPISLRVRVGRATGPEASMSHPRTLIVAGADSQAQIIESYVGATGQKPLHQRGHRGVRRRERRRRSLQGRRKSARRVPHREPARAHLAGAALLVALVHARRASSATTSSRVLDGEGGDCTLNGLYLADGDRLVDNHTTIDHAKPHCGSHEVYKGILGGTRARGLQRQDHRPPGRAEDRRQADQPGAAAVRRRDDQHQAAARDLRRRREVHARRDDRAARRRGDLLPARPRLDLAEARDMLIHAFAGEVLDRVKIEPLRAALEDDALRPAARRISRRSTRHDARRRTAARAIRSRRSTSRASAPTSRSFAARSTASRSSISTTRRRRRSRRWSSTRSSRYYTEDNANVHRGVHELSERATRGVRERPRKVAAVLQRAARPARSSSRATPPRASTSWRTTFGRTLSAPATRC